MVSPNDGDLSIKRASRRAEEELIRRALAKTAGNRTRAAELLEISHRALLYKIKEYGIGSARGDGRYADPCTFALNSEARRIDVI